jgi:hypothetical protein
MDEIPVEETKMEFMRKSRFESIKDKFHEIAPAASEAIDKANNDDILRLSLTFNSPVKVLEAEVFNEEKFIELAF